MTVEVQTVQIQFTSEHLVLIGLAVWLVVPKLRRLKKKK